MEHWAKEHKFKCKLRSQAEAVGEPFIISLPKSKATYANIMRNLECRCRQVFFSYETYAGFLRSRMNLTHQ